MTLRELILNWSKDDRAIFQLFKYLNEIDDMRADSKCSLFNTLSAYSPVIGGLMLKPVKTGVMPIVLTTINDTDLHDKPIEYVNVSRRNPNYIDPPENLKPWGCWGDESPPEGFYNANDDKYSKWFSLLAPWGDMIDAEIENDSKLTNPTEILGEILYEITWHGYTEEDGAQFLDYLNEQMEGIKSGKIKTHRLEKNDGDKWNIEISENIFGDMDEKP